MSFIRKIPDRFGVALAGMLLGAALAQPGVAQEAYPAVEGNVSFEAVFALPYRDSDYRVGYGPGPLQFGQLWLAATEAASRGLLVLIHGGCWLNQYGIDHSQALSTALSDAGYDVLSLEYRRTGDAGGGWPGTFEDILLALSIVPTLAPYGVNLARMALLGHSAGGHLAVLAGTRADPLPVQPDLVVGLAAITDIVSYGRDPGSCQQATPLFMGGTPEEKPAQYAQANPPEHTLHPDTVLLHGTLDQIVPLSQASLPGATTQLTEGAGHFDWVHPGTPAFADLLQLLDEAL